MVGGILQTFGLYEEIAIALLIILVLSKIKFVIQLYKYFKKYVNLIGLYAFVYVFLQMGTQAWQDKDMNFILLRTTDNHSAHFLAFFALMLFGAIVFMHPRPSFLRSVFFVMGITGFHEFLWNLFYLPTCYGVGACAYKVAQINGGVNLFTQGILITAVLMMNLAVWYRKEFKAVLRNLPYWLIFMVLWELAGFYVTLDARLEAVTSVYYLDVYVNLTEILSWFVFLYPTLTAYLRIHPLKTNFLYLRWKQYGVRLGMKYTFTSLKSDTYGSKYAKRLWQKARQQTKQTAWNSEKSYQRNKSLSRPNRTSTTQYLNVLKGLSKAKHSLSKHLHVRA